MKYQVVNTDRNLATLRYLDESGQEVVIPVHPLAYLELEMKEVLSYSPTLAISPTEVPQTFSPPPPPPSEPEPLTSSPSEPPVEEEPLSEDPSSMPPVNPSSKKKRSS